MNQKGPALLSSSTYDSIRLLKAANTFAVGALDFRKSG
jgi:hypothetical protein